MIILLLADAALELTDELEQAIEEHAASFVELYFACAKPKFHWLFHLPRCLPALEEKPELFCHGKEKQGG